MAHLTQPSHPVPTSHSLDEETSPVSIPGHRALSLRDGTGIQVSCGKSVSCGYKAYLGEAIEKEERYRLPPIFSPGDSEPW